MPLDSQLLHDFIHGFFGYGNLKAPLWFIGLEEGGGGKCDEVARRLKTWNNCVRPLPVADIARFHRDIGLPIEDRGREPTWDSLIRAVLVGRGMEVTPTAIREYRSARWARRRECLLELMPLPSPGNNDWFYPDWVSDFPELATRDAYVAAYQAMRIETIQNLIHQEQPRCVAFYGRTRRDEWLEIADSEVQGEENRIITLQPRKETAFFIVDHPRYALDPGYWDLVGQVIAPFIAR